MDMDGALSTYADLVHFVPMVCWAHLVPMLSLAHLVPMLIDLISLIK